jgi:hypothetical protein
MRSYSYQSSSSYRLLGVQDPKHKRVVRRMQRLANLSQRNIVTYHATCLVYNSLLLYATEEPETCSGKQHVTCGSLDTTISASGLS